MKSTRLFFLILCNFLMITLFITSVGTTRAETTQLPEVDISTSPHKVLFNVGNMKPGDWATRTITVNNKGKQDFKYTMSVNMKSGSKKLFDEFMLKVSDKDRELYNGKLADFKGFESRTLYQSKSEDLTFQVDFPSHLGNEFQGLATEVEFKFYVAGTLGGLLPVDGPKLPDTATGMFNIIGAGAILVFGGMILFALDRFRKRRLDIRKA
ncbi:cell wall protein [Bacillus sp. BGMRC 2118]|nr:cell wall protein [Bacillus sp. BGMRC 2118]